MTSVAIAGSTGSIGKQTLEVIAASESGKYQLVALSANSSADEIIKQAKTFKPNLVVVNDESARKIVARELAATNPKIEVIADIAAMAGIADVVVNGVVGFAGLSVTIATLAAGKRLALCQQRKFDRCWPSRCAVAKNIRCRNYPC